MIMILFINHLHFILFTVFLPHFVYCYSTLPGDIDGQYKGFRTLWKPYSQWYFPEIIRRNQTEITKSGTPVSPPVSRGTTYVTIDWDYKQLFMKEDDDYDDLSPGLVQLIKSKLLNKKVTKEFKLVRGKDWRRWQFARSGREFPKGYPPDIPTPTPIPKSVLSPTWKQPSSWRTPDPERTIIWAWTTTPTTALDHAEYYYNQQYGSDDAFYDFLRLHSTKVGGRTEHRKPLPTTSSIFGTTFVWRFWSYNPESRQIETYLALEMEEQSKTMAPSSVLGNVKNASCYVCGLDLPGIPRQPSCHHIFENEDHRYKFLRNTYKRKCYPGEKGQESTNKKWYGQLYRGGCFKRFTDVGIEYNERGCRTMEPTMGSSYASKRFARLEKILYDVDDGCVVSPLASLTPFSRAISLYVRYHVCVCKGKYCNHAPRTRPSAIITIMRSLYLFFVISFKK